MPMMNSSSSTPSPSISKFILKLWSLVNDESTDGIVEWSQDGTCFIIKDQTQFVQLLPYYFKHNNFASFNRQLNLYGFRKVQDYSSSHAQVTNTNYLAFSEVNFMRNNPEGLAKIVRRTRTSNGAVFNSNVNDNNNSCHNVMITVTDRDENVNTNTNANFIINGGGNWANSGGGGCKIEQDNFAPHPTIENNISNNNNNNPINEECVNNNRSVDQNYLNELMAIEMRSLSDRAEFNSESLERLKKENDRLNEEIDQLKVQQKKHEMIISRLLQFFINFTSPTTTSASNSDSKRKRKFDDRTTISTNDIPLNSFNILTGSFLNGRNHTASHTPTAAASYNASSAYPFKVTGNTSRVGNQPGSSGDVSGTPSPNGVSIEELFDDQVSPRTTVNSTGVYQNAVVPVKKTRSDSESSASMPDLATFLDTTTNRPLIQSANKSNSIVLYNPNNVNSRTNQKTTVAQPKAANQILIGKNVLSTTTAAATASGSLLSSQTTPTPFTTRTNSEPKFLKVRLVNSEGKVVPHVVKLIPMSDSTTSQQMEPVSNYYNELNSNLTATPSKQSNCVNSTNPVVVPQRSNNNLFQSTTSLDINVSTREHSAGNVINSSTVAHVPIVHSNPDLPSNVVTAPAVDVTSNNISMSSVNENVTTFPLQNESQTILPSVMKQPSTQTSLNEKRCFSDLILSGAFAMPNVDGSESTSYLVPNPPPPVETTVPVVSNVISMQQTAAPPLVYPSVNNNMDPMPVQEAPYGTSNPLINTISMPSPNSGNPDTIYHELTPHCPPPDSPFSFTDPFFNVVSPSGLDILGIPDIGNSPKPIDPDSIYQNPSSVDSLRLLLSGGVSPINMPTDLPPEITDREKYPEVIMDNDENE